MAPQMALGRRGQRAGSVQAGRRQGMKKIQVEHRQGTGRADAEHRAGCAQDPVPSRSPPYPKIMKKKVSGRSKGKSILRSLLKIAAMVSGEAGGVLRGGREVLGGPHPARPCLARC